MKRITYLLLLSLLVAGCSSEPKVKYVFYFIGDGMGVNEVIGTNLYNQANDVAEAVNFSQFPVLNFITTVSANSLVTDSSAAGTALATGVKINNSAVGVDPDGNWVSNLTEWAHAVGFGTAVATSVGVNHATPASFVAHSTSRNGYEEIALQMIDSPVDFMAGSAFLTDRGGHDAAWLEHKADSAGIVTYKGTAAIKDIDLDAPRVLCLSGKVEDSLPYAIDRKADDTRLADFTDAGIRYLESRFGKKGFFFMIEGGKIDYAGHGNDAAACFQEVNDMAESVDLALAFLARHPKETLILVTADHETGGLMLGSGRYEMHPDRLAKQHACVDELTNLFRASFFPTDKPFKTPSWDAVKAFFTEHLGLWGEVEVNERAERELKDIYDRTFGKGGDRNLTEENLYSSNFRIVADVVRYYDRAAGYQWSFGSHSGSPVGLYVTGACAEEFNTVKDNAEIAPLIAKLAGYKK